MLAADDGGDAALDLVVEAGWEALSLAVDGAEEEALQPRVAGRRDARQRPVLLEESDGPAHGERCGRARDVREAEEQLEVRLEPVLCACGVHDRLDDRVDCTSGRATRACPSQVA